MLGTNTNEYEIGDFADLVLSDGPLAFDYLMGLISEIKSFDLSEMSASMVIILSDRFPQ